MTRFSQRVLFCTRIAVVLIIAASQLAYAQQSKAESAKEASPKPPVAGTAATTAPGITQEQGAAILSELRQIRELLERQAQQSPSPSGHVTNMKMALDRRWPVLGKDDAPVTIVEFTDLQCPYCQRVHAAIFQRLKEQYIDTGKVRFVSRDLPLANHSYAFKAAEALHCAGDQGKFWELRGEILAGGKPPSESEVLSFAGTLNLNTDLFRECLASDKYKGQIEEDLKSATIAQVYGTPTFLIARTAKVVLEGSRVTGALSFSNLQQQIDQILKPDSLAQKMQ